MPIQVNDASTQLELVYIDDLIDEMITALQGGEHHCEFDGTEAVAKENGRYCYVPVSHKVTLGEIVSLLDEFKAQPKTLLMPKIPAGSFAKKLYSTYLSYLPKEKAIFDLKMNSDDRGSFTELMKTADCGPIFRKHIQTGYNKRATLAQHKVGVFYCGCRPRSYSGEKNRS